LTASVNQKALPGFISKNLVGGRQFSVSVSVSTRQVGILSYPKFMAGIIDCSQTSASGKSAGGKRGVRVDDGEWDEGMTAVPESSTATDTDIVAIAGAMPIILNRRWSNLTATPSRARGTCL